MTINYLKNLNRIIIMYDTLSIYLSLKVQNNDYYE